MRERASVLSVRVRNSLGAQRRPRVWSPAIGIVLLLTGLGLCWVSAADAVIEQATLTASFSPDRLSTSTTIGFGFHVQTAEGTAPPPMTAVDLRMPAGMNFTSTTLGLAICQPAALMAEGTSGCPVNSRIGFGTALVEVPFGTGSGHEIPELDAMMGPPSKGNLVILFYADGKEPVYAQLVFSGEVLPQFGAFGSELATTVPPVPSVPGGPDVSIVKVAATIGPSHILYVKRVHGKTVHFHPKGVSVPEHCPKGGFPFSAEFAFQDGSHTTASTTVPCPKPSRHK
jgi:hypothetical protein